MGKLSDAYANQKSNATPNSGSYVDQNGSIKLHNMKWLMKISEKTGFIINDDREKAQKILDALNRSEGYCPCGGKGDAFICPCVVMREKGICKCGLFNNVTPIVPSNTSSSAKIRRD